MKKILQLLLILTVCANGTIAFAQLDGLSQDLNAGTEETTDLKKNGNFSIHGYVQGNMAVQRNDNRWNTTNYDFVRAGGLLQLELEGSAYDKAHFYTNVRLEYDAANRRNMLGLMENDWYGLITAYPVAYRYVKDNEQEAQPVVDIREAYVDLYSEYVTVRAGQQLISWGELEGIIVPTDMVMPWDYSTRTTEFEDSRLSVTAIDMQIYLGKMKKHKLELVWIPVFRPTKLPYGTPFKQGLARVVFPHKQVRNSEYAGRLKGSFGNVRYALGYMYGFDDLGDVKFKILGTTSLGTVIPTLPPSLAGISLPTNVWSEMVYNRVHTPTLDLSIGIADKLEWKVSGAFFMREDFYGKNDGKKNPTVEYLTGPETTNVFWDIYMSMYLGQIWVINYTEPQAFNKFFIPTEPILKGFNQHHPYQWIVSAVLQRSFFRGNIFEASLRFSVNADPSFTDYQYVLQPNFTLKITDGVRTVLGFIIANRQGEEIHMGILEFRYTF